MCLCTYIPMQKVIPPYTYVYACSCLQNHPIKCILIHSIEVRGHACALSIPKVYSIVRMIGIHTHIYRHRNVLWGGGQVIAFMPWVQRLSVIAAPVITRESKKNKHVYQLFPMDLEPLYSSGHLRCQREVAMVPNVCTYVPYNTIPLLLISSIISLSSHSTSLPLPPFISEMCTLHTHTNTVADYSTHLIPNWDG